MYEVEIKVEITEEERNSLVKSFFEKGVLSKGVKHQNNYYIEANKSPFGGYDIKRMRDEDGTYIFTEKISEIVDGKVAKKENEHEVSKEEFEKVISGTPVIMKIVKDRESFETTYQDTDLSITIDSTKFDHSPMLRHFLEAEVIVKNKEEIHDIKELIENFLKEILGKDEIVEAPGMFAMAFEKK